jgi:hypothetical protein
MTPGLKGPKDYFWPSVNVLGGSETTTFEKVAGPDTFEPK